MRPDRLIDHGQRISGQDVLGEQRGQHHPVTRAQAAPAAERSRDHDVRPGRHDDHATGITSKGVSCPAMMLVAFSIEGYRRFVAKTSVKLHGRLIALVGPNEAGKTSLLTAIAHLDKPESFQPTERQGALMLNHSSHGIYKSRTLTRNS